MGVTAGYDQRQHGKAQVVISLSSLLKQHSVNVAFEMVHGDEGFLQTEGKSLGVADADKQCARQPGTLGYGHRIDGLISLSSIGQRLADDRDDCA